jgi:ribosomal RNA-processing protein 1
MSDKPLYQKEVSLKISQIGNKLGEGSGLCALTKRIKWFDACIHVFNQRWNKIDNFRIDKFLLFIRLQLNAIFTLIKNFKYEDRVVKWFYHLIHKLFLNANKVENSVIGIPLHICDVIVEEMHKVDCDASLEQIAAIL